MSRLSLEMPRCIEDRTRLNKVESCIAACRRGAERCIAMAA
ncbi:hypothetical protein QMO56_07390 [Roseomonas sp. E05]|nr:hypothetical protein [Roseomonas sp. E05]MDJ0387934.1 hypothetical protein [Roseomonas sp. E05]